MDGFRVQAFSASTREPVGEQRVVNAYRAHEAACELRGQGYAVVVTPPLPLSVRSREEW